MLSLQNDSHCRHNVNNGNTACVLWCGGHTQHLPAQAQPPLQACIYSKSCVAECVWISILSTPCCRQQWSPGLIADDTTNVTLIADDSGQQLPPPRCQRHGQTSKAFTLDGCCSHHHRVGLTRPLEVSSIVTMATTDVIAQVI